mgnify:CR=1 FL=1
MEIFLRKIGLDTSSRMGGSVQFFLYDVLKITILLCILIFMISYIQSYFPPERSKKIMGRFHGIWANCIAALLGTVTPFCSCSSIPLFIGFTSAGLPLGVTFFLSDFFSNGRFRKSGFADEYLWIKSCYHICDCRACYCGNRWNNY